MRHIIAGIWNPLIFLGLQVCVAEFGIGVLLIRRTKACWFRVRLGFYSKCGFTIFFAIREGLTIFQ